MEICYRDEPTLTNDGALNNFPVNSTSFKFKIKITGSTGGNDTKIVKKKWYHWII